MCWCGGPLLGAAAPGGTPEAMELLSRRKACPGAEGAVAVGDGGCCWGWAVAGEGPWSHRDGTGAWCSHCMAGKCLCLVR